jgi:cytochrome c556
MMRVLVAATASVFVVTAVLAQSSAIEQRTALMKKQSEAAWRGLKPMAEGKAEYDQAKVDEAFAKLKDTTSRFLTVFPADQKGGVDPKATYFASDKVWDNRADFEARAAKFAKDVAELAPKANSLDGLKAVYPQLDKNCQGCHDVYRVKKPS